MYLIFWEKGIQGVAEEYAEEDETGGKGGRDDTEGHGEGREQKPGNGGGQRWREMRGCNEGKGGGE